MSEEKQVVTASGKKNGKPGRPTKEIDLNQLSAIAKLCPTMEEIAAALKMTRATLYNAMKANPIIRETIDQGKQLGRMSLRRSIWKNALEGNVQAQKLLAVNELGMRDKIDVDQTVAVVKPVLNLELSGQTEKGRKLYETQKANNTRDSQQGTQDYIEHQDD